MVTPDKWKPVLYSHYYAILKDIAEEYGYALAIHGSFTRDMDLIAVPWVENPKSHEELLRAFGKALGISYSNGAYCDDAEQKPNGRTAYVLHEGIGYLDISITPTIEKEEKQ